MAHAQALTSSRVLDGARISLVSAPTMASALLRDTISLEQDERLAFVSIELDAGWKTYWRLPGRFGLAPVLDWSESENVASVQTIFPMPELFDEGDGTSIGYADDTLWPVRVRHEDPKQPIVLHLMLELGLCEVLCLPASAELSARLSPAAGEVASLSDVLNLAQSLPEPELPIPSGAFVLEGELLSFSSDDHLSAESFAIAENEEGRHALMLVDETGILRGPWRYEQLPSRLTLISSGIGIQVFSEQR